ncbi:MAG TPA: ferritin family protein [Bacteroidota bacterium]|nr:ferritin family protein [Bacteroidota bacterium]
MSPLRTETINWNDITLEEVFELAIADEEYARDYYRHAAELAGNPHTRELLLKLSEMEQGHADSLRKELEELRIERQEEAGMAD